MVSLAAESPHFATIRGLCDDIVSDRVAALRKMGSYFMVSLATGSFDMNFLATESQHFKQGLGICNDFVSDGVAAF